MQNKTVCLLNKFYIISITCLIEKQIDDTHCFVIMFEIYVYVCEHVYTGLIGTIRVILVYEADDFYLLKVFFLMRM